MSMNKINSKGNFIAAVIAASLIGLITGAFIRIVVWKPEVKKLKKTHIVYRNIDVNELRKNVSFHGNLKDYNLLKKYYMEHGQYERIFYYSLLMADKYNHPQAYKDVSNALDSVFSHYGIEPMDRESNMIAEHYYRLGQSFH